MRLVTGEPILRFVCNAIAIGLFVYVSSSSAGTPARACKNMKDVENVILDVFKASKASDLGVLNGPMTREELRKVSSFYVLGKSTNLVFMSEKDGMVELPVSIDTGEEMFSAATLIEVPVIALLEDGKILESRIQLQNKNVAQESCVYGSALRFNEIRPQPIE